MTVWVTDDENKIPVLVESPILIGFIRAELNKYEGLRNPLKSKTGWEKFSRRVLWTAYSQNLMDSFPEWIPGKVA